jgi:hypothetical protein
VQVVDARSAEDGRTGDHIPQGIPNRRRSPRPGILEVPFDRSLKVTVITYRLRDFACGEPDLPVKKELLTEGERNGQQERHANRLRMVEDKL